MGLSEKQVSSDGQGWNHTFQAGTSELPKPPSLKRQSSKQQQQQGEPLKCPRCDSTNTKFCYYNNYNKSQPRHFCKTCKSHWTKGGTLRKVPVGGGRKNKRKASNAARKTALKISSAATSATTSGISNSNMTVQVQQPRVSLPIAMIEGVDEKNFSEAFYQTVVRQLPCSIPESSANFSSESLNASNDGLFVGSTLSLPQNDQDPQLPYSNWGSFESNPCSTSSTISSIQSPTLSLPQNDQYPQFPYSNWGSSGSNPCSISSIEYPTLSVPQNDQDPQLPYSNWASFEGNPCSISSIQSSNVYDYTGEANALEETVISSGNTAMSGSSTSDPQQIWSMATTTSSVMDISSDWVWNGVDFASVDADIWDDFDDFASVDADLAVTWEDTEVNPWDWSTGLTKQGKHKN